MQLFLRETSIKNNTSEDILVFLRNNSRQQTCFFCIYNLILQTHTPDPGCSDSNCTVAHVLSPEIKDPIKILLMAWAQPEASSLLGSCFGSEGQRGNKPFIYRLSSLKGLSRWEVFGRDANPPNYFHPPYLSVPSIATQGARPQHSTFRLTRSHRWDVTTSPWTETWSHPLIFLGKSILLMLPDLKQTFGYFGGWEHGRFTGSLFLQKDKERGIW